LTAEYKGDDFLYLVEIEDGAAVKAHRFFNQTNGTSTIEADDIELSTKDKTGSDYGKVTETLSIEGVLTLDDPAIKYVKNAIRNKHLVRIIEVDTRHKTTEEGLYKINSFEITSSNGEFATYTLEASLNGSITEGELTEIPAGATDEEHTVPNEPVPGA